MLYELLDQLAEREIAVISKALRQDKYDTGNRVVGMAWNFAYRDLVSNSHHAPRSGKTNWGRKDGMPRGYPGFEGRLWIRYSTGSGSFANDAFRNSVLHTGTGGAGSYTGPWEALSTRLFNTLKRRDYDKYLHIFSWDCRFFLDDVPKIRDALEKELVWRALNGTDRRNVTHEFLWNDVTTLEQDRKMLYDVITDKSMA